VDDLFRRSIRGRPKVVVKRDPAVPDPSPFDAYKELNSSQKALIDQLVEALTKQSESSRRRLYGSRVLRMAALTMATGVPIAVAASASNWVVGLLGGAAALLEGAIQVFRHDERALVEIRRYHRELQELEDFLASANDYRKPKPFELLVDRLSEIRRQAQRADLVVLSRASERQPQESKSSLSKPSSTEAEDKHF
jgi:hypothetical protein